MKITIEFDPELPVKCSESEREANSGIVKKMLDAQNLLEHERSVLSEERTWIDLAWSAKLEELPEPPEYVSNWAVAHFKMVISRRRGG